MKILISWRLSTITLDCWGFICRDRDPKQAGRCTKSSANTSPAAKAGLTYGRARAKLTSRIIKGRTLLTKDGRKPPRMAEKLGKGNGSELDTAGDKGEGDDCDDDGDEEDGDDGENEEGEEGIVVGGMEKSETTAHVVEEQGADKGDAEGEAKVEAKGK